MTFWRKMQNFQYWNHYFCGKANVFKNFCWGKAPIFYIIQKGFTCGLFKNISLIINDEYIFGFQDRSNPVLIYYKSSSCSGAKKSVTAVYWIFLATIIILTLLKSGEWSIQPSDNSLIICSISPSKLMISLCKYLNCFSYCFFEVFYFRASYYKHKTMQV